MSKKEYPSELELKRITEWDYRDGFEGLAEYICSIWHYDDWAEFRDLKTDEFGTHYRELRLATGGWSGNESIVSALHDNKMFFWVCWKSSHRGGLHIYYVPIL